MKQPQNIIGIWIILFCASLLRYNSPSQVEERLIVPDSVEYAVSAVNLARGEGYRVVLNGVSQPPRFPPGFPVLLAPFYYIFGDAPGNGIFCVLLFSVVSIGLFYFLAKGLFGEKTALWSALFLAFSPLHLYWSRFIMADIPSFCIGLLAVLILFGGPLRRWRVFWIGSLLGIAVWVKFLNGLLAGSIILFFLFSKIPWRQKGLRLFWFLLGLLLFLLPLFCYHKLTFGTFFKSGYTYWDPEFSLLKNTFSFSYALRAPLLAMAKQGFSSNLPALLQFFLGVFPLWHQNFYLFLIVPFCGIGIWKAPREFLHLAIWVCMSFSGFFSFYFYQGTRYLLLPASFILLLTAFGFHLFFERLPKAFQRGIWVVITAFSLVALGVSWHSGGEYPRRDDAQFLREKTEHHAFILSSWDAVSFYEMIQRGTERVYLPLSEEQEYVSRGIVDFIVADRDKERMRDIIQGHPTYIDSHSCREYPKSCAALRKQFRFKKVGTSGGIDFYRLEH